jgi:hypothetical protein
MAGSVSDDEFDRLDKATFLLQRLSVPMIVVCLVGFVALGIISWRRRAISRGACVLLMLAWPGPHALRTPARSRTHPGDCRQWAGPRRAPCRSRGEAAPGRANAPKLIKTTEPNGL